jgi:hypothetical protein
MSRCNTKKLHMQMMLLVLKNTLHLREGNLKTIYGGERTPLVTAVAGSSITEFRPKCNFEPRRDP